MKKAHTTCIIVVDNTNGHKKTLLFTILRCDDAVAEETEGNTVNITRTKATEE